MAAKRLTRKEIVREDAIQKTLTTTSSWLLENKNLLIVGFVAVVVLLVGIFLFRAHLQSTREAGQAAFAEALSIYHAPIAGEEPESPPGAEDTDSVLPPPEPEYQFESESERNKEALDAFQNVAQEYSGYEIGNLARYYLGLLYYQEGDSEAASRELEAVMSDAGNDEIKNLARNLRAEIAFAREQPEVAIHHLRQITDQPSSNFPIENVLMRLGRTYEELGQLEDALASYRRVTTEYAGTEAAQQAQARVQELEGMVGESTDEEASEESTRSTAAPGTEPAQ